ncbi:MAG TPA: alpha/beta hydrolase, partial [Sphingomicrobium sp.]|nr:alpha/beta hydrolase [Sphingomicrobium sp.]
YGTGPNIVLVPGRLFMPEFAILARPDRSVIQYDMRNRGLSKRVEDVGQITIMGDVADVEALRRHFGAEKVSLVGYSYLGLMIALYAAEHPDRVERLVQIGAVPRKFGTAYPADQQAGSDSLNAQGKAAEAAWNALRPNLNSADPKEACAVLQRYVGYQLVGNPANHGKVPNVCGYDNESIANFGRHLGAHFGDIQKRDFPREPFTKLEQPVLTLHGTLDRNAPYGSGLEWATTFRNGRLVTIEGGAHQLWVDDPTVLADIDKFLAGEWPARAQWFGRE